MEKALDLAGTIAGCAGTLLCILAAIARLAGTVSFAGSEVVTWFVLGIGLLAGACFAKLQVMSMRPR